MQTAWLSGLGMVTTEIRTLLPSLFNISIHIQVSAPGSKAVVFLKLLPFQFRSFGLLK
jgi:hypothetical protein